MNTTKKKIKILKFPFNFILYYKIFLPISFQVEFPYFSLMERNFLPSGSTVLEGEEILALYTTATILIHLLLINEYCIYCMYIYIYIYIYI